MSGTWRQWHLGGLVALALGLLVIAAGTGRAHTVNEDENWYFDGSLYDDDEISDEARKDPINLIFMGGEASLDRVEDHLTIDWDGKDDMESSAFCRSDLEAFWRFFPGFSHDKQDRQLRAGSFLCRNQFHIRLWDDLEHSRGTVHTRNEWVVAGIHHERVAAKFCCATHKPDRDWDTVRIQALNGMDTHCSTRRWRFHFGAAKTYQEYKNSGWIGRISMRHRVSGCDGA